MMMVKEKLSKYNRASVGAKEIVDALEFELRKLLPDVERNDAADTSSLGAKGYKKVAYAYPAIRHSKVTVYFSGSLEADPIPVDGMPKLVIRDNLSSPWAKLTPFFVVVEDLSQVGPFAKFLLNYAVPLSVSKRKGKSNVQSFTFPEEVSELVYSEGQLSRITVNRYERDTKARAECIRIHGSSCKCCGMSFKDRYGDLAEGYIHVHHIVEISKRDGQYKLNPVTDLISLCPNCHSVAHLSDPPLTLAELQKMYHH